MRTPAILFATLLLTATAASAAPRSLSTGEPTTVELPAQKVQVLEAPKVELAPAPAPTAQADTTRTTPAPQPEPKSVEAPPAVTTPPAEIKPVVAAPVETKPAVQPKQVEAVKPVKQAAVQRKPKQHQASVEQRVHRGLRGMEGMIGIGVSTAIGFAIANGAPYYW